jgi:hypothetical protein
MGTVLEFLDILSYGCTPTPIYVLTLYVHSFPERERELVASREGNSKRKLARGSTLTVWKRHSAVTPLIILKSAELSRAIAPILHDKDQLFC